MMNNKQWDAIWINARLVTLEKNTIEGECIEQGALAVLSGKIVWIGFMSALPAHPDELAKKVHDVKGACITPGLIDCHTHLVYAGNRCHEFEMRLQGATYEAIAKSGGGIRSTVTATRAATEEDLFQQSVKRARALLAEGVTTIEIKSGYGLDLETELKMLRVAKRIGETLPMTVMTTLLAAHTLPVEYQTRADEYIDFVCEKIIPEAAHLKLADFVDVFCETIGFTLHQTERVFAAAKKYGLGLKCHAEQLTNSGSAELAATYQAISVDHLEFLSESGVRALAKAGTTAVLLPGAFYFLRETQLPPIQLLREYGVPIAIATDSNPGTSPITSLLLIMNMACTLFRLTPTEALAGVTIHAAKALGVSDVKGSLTVGKAADFVIWDIESPAELAYQMGLNPCIGVVRGGVKSVG